MSMKPDKRTIVIDLLGTVTLVAIVFWGAWYTFFKSNTAGSKVDGLVKQVEATSTTLRTLEQDLDQRKSEHRDLLARATEREKLPSDIPIERTLADITLLAHRHGARMVGVSPLSEVHYPGVLEKRYRVTLEGTFQGMLGFFRDFENQDYWADVTYLKIEPAEQQDGVEARRMAELTLSFFSAVNEPEPDASS